MKKHIVVLALSSFGLGGSAVLLAMSAIYEDRVSTLVATSFTLLGMLILSVTNFRILIQRGKNSEKEKD